MMVRNVVQRPARCSVSTVTAASKFTTWIFAASKPGHELLLVPVFFQTAFFELPGGLMDLRRLILLIECRYCSAGIRQ